MDPTQNPYQSQFGGSVPYGNATNTSTYMAPYQGGNVLPNYQQLMLQSGQAGAQSNQDWNGLISQLKQNAAGNGPAQKQAQAQYTQASQNTAGQLAGQAHGASSPAAARQAAIQQGAIGQGMSNGLAQATNQATLNGQQSLMGALNGQAQMNQGYMGLQNQLSGQAGQQGLTQEQIDNQAIQGLFSGGSQGIGALAMAM